MASLQDLFTHNRAWAAQMGIHGRAFGVHGGLLQDLHMTVSSADSIEPLYRAARA